MIPWRATLPAMALFLLVTTCGGETDDANLGVAGASCMRTPDCRSPLQCIANVCTDLSGGADVLGSDVGQGYGSDLVFAGGDTGGPLPDIYRPRDVVQPFDVGPDWRPHGPDAQVSAPDTFTGCQGLGVESAWTGEFTGNITFWNVEAPPGFEGQVPDSGVLLTYGDLNFEIRCLEQKLVVAGALDGYGEAEGEPGSHPFEADLVGEYNPLTETMTARIEGHVLLYFIIVVYFEGEFTGELVRADRFDGDWAGAATGNSMDLEGEAQGGGTWWARSAD